jgi:acetylglutamate synthase
MPLTHLGCREGVRMLTFSGNATSFQSGLRVEIAKRDISVGFHAQGHSKLQPRHSIIISSDRDCRSKHRLIQASRSASLDLRTRCTATLVAQSRGSPALLSLPATFSSKPPFMQNITSLIQSLFTVFGVVASSDGPHHMSRYCQRPCSIC